MAPLELLGAVILHSLWQGALIAVVLWALLRLIADDRPQIRYLLACAALVALLTALSPQANSVTDFAVLAVPTLPASLPPLEWIVAFWLGGVSVLSLRLIGGGLLTARLRSRATRLAPPEVQRRLLSLMNDLGMRRPLAVYLSQAVDSPLVIGWLKPVILLPVSALSGLGLAQIEALLAHELAHIRRHDTLVNACQTAIEVLMFYHPATWWISGAIRREREHCCDDIAAALCGHGDYAHALSRLEELRQPTPLYALAASDGSLLARIRRLLGEPREGDMRFHLIGIAFLAALLLIALAAGFGSRPDVVWRDASGRVTTNQPGQASWWGRDGVVDRGPFGDIDFRLALPHDFAERRLEQAERELEAHMESIAVRFERFGVEGERRIEQTERGFVVVGEEFERLGSRLERSFERMGESFERIGESFERIGESFETMFDRLERLFSF